MDARRLALAVLERVDAGARSDVELGREPSGSELAEPDRTLATRIVYGVLAHPLVENDVIDLAGVKMEFSFLS